MSLDAATIERLVREVLREMEPQPAAAPRPVLASIARLTEKSIPLATGVATAAEVRPDFVDCSERVVTANWLQEHVPSGQRVRLGAKAIITPAAHDWLKQKHIAWEQGTASSAPASAAPSTVIANSRWKIIQQATAGIATAAVKSVQQQLRTAVELCGSTAEAIVLGRSLICRGDHHGVVVLTNQPQLVACQVNRQEQVRAVEVRDFREWSTLQRELNPNIACVNPSAKSLAELKHLLSQIVSSAVS